MERLVYSSIRGAPDVARCWLPLGVGQFYKTAPSITPNACGRIPFSSPSLARSNTVVITMGPISVPALHIIRPGWAGGALWYCFCHFFASLRVGVFQMLVPPRDLGAAQLMVKLILTL